METKKNSGQMFEEVLDSIYRKPPVRTEEKKQEDKKEEDGE